MAFASNVCARSASVGAAGASAWDWAPRCAASASDGASRWPSSPRPRRGGRRPDRQNEAKRKGTGDLRVASPGLPSQPSPQHQISRRRVTAHLPLPPAIEVASASARGSIASVTSQTPNTFATCPCRAADVRTSVNDASSSRNGATTACSFGQRRSSSYVGKSARSAAGASSNPRPEAAAVWTSTNRIGPCILHRARMRASPRPQPGNAPCPERLAPRTANERTPLPTRPSTRSPSLARRRSPRPPSPPPRRGASRAAPRASSTA